MSWTNPTPLFMAVTSFVAVFLLLLVMSYLQVRVGGYVQRRVAIRWALVAAASGALVLSAAVTGLYVIAR